MSNSDITYNLTIKMKAYRVIYASCCMQLPRILSNLIVFRLWVSLVSWLWRLMGCLLFA